MAAGVAVRLSARDSGRTIALRTGDSLALTLAENPSTGFSWQVTSSGAPVAVPLGEPTFKADSKLRGSGGATTFRYRAAAEGTAELKMVYRRPWEKDVPPAAVFRVTLVVKK